MKNTNWNTDWRWSFITKSEIINKIWNDNIENYKKKDVEYIVNSFVNTIAEEIKKDLKVKIDGLGTFSTYFKDVYIKKAIDTGNTNIIRNVKCVSFKPSNKLKSEQ